jgi:DNA-binding NtrC family response regulator
VDFRLVAATNRDLKREVKEGRFRKDLFFRLAVVRIMVPSLRQRRDDIPRLARHFLWQAGCVDVDAVLSEELLGVLCTRSWPGNVRELRNVIERASILADGARALDLTPSERREALPSPAEPPPIPTVQEHDPKAPPPLTLPSPYLELDYKAAKELLLNQFEVQYLTRLVKQHGSNISHIARGAGVDRHLVRKLLRKHGLLG